MSERILVYLLRRDLRVDDNPIFHAVSKMVSQSDAAFTHVLPIYVFPAQQMEVSGFLKSGSDKSPYPEARSQVGNFWRCGHLRAKFVAESVWDVKQALKSKNSDLSIRVGMVEDVIQHVVDHYKQQDGKSKLTAVWMTSEEGVEEKREERSIRNLLTHTDVDFKLCKDEKYFIDDDDVPFDKPFDLPDVFTSYRKTVEPLEHAPRDVLGDPASLLPLPSDVPPQADPFSIPDSLDGIVSALHKPLSPSLDLKNPPKMADAASKSAFPFTGGARSAHARMRQLLEKGYATTYKKTRNGMLGDAFSTKLSAFLALGCISSRQVHRYLLDFEQAKTELGKGAEGYGKGENDGTKSIRFELLWRDYFRLCTRKFGERLFRVEGFRDDRNVTWNYDGGKLERWLEGSTGTGLIDASQRELFLTGYTSNRARQNVASFLAKHLGLDWRLGAEWYECNLVDYDLSSNWGNWQYNSGVGNDPREDGQGRKFNPVKQASDYDGQAEYIKTWVKEIEAVDSPELCWQYWKLGEKPEEVKRLNLQGNPGVEEPLVKINFVIGRGGRGRGRGRGGGGGGGGPGVSRRGRGGRRSGDNQGRGRGGGQGRGS